MKVLITLPVKVGFDGMTKQVLSYSKYMDKTNIEMDLLSCRGFDPDMKEEVKEAGFNNVFRLEYRDNDQKKYFLNLLKLIRDQKYDVIHANGQSATLAMEMLAGKLGGCKLRIAHSHNSACQHIRAHKLLLPLFNITYNDAIACSKEAGNWLFGKREYWILNNGIDVNKFSFTESTRNRVRKELKLSDSVTAVGNVAAFEPKKNHIFLIHLFDNISKINPNYKLFLWGIDGSTKEEILREISERKLDNVIYMGTTNHMCDFLNGMDLMVLPSQYEGFPVSVVEWQASGLPCLLSETITKDININGLVNFLPIDKGVNIWEKELLLIKRNEKRNDTKWTQILKNKGYDIRTNANQLKEHYVEKLSKIR